jgi:hypothetical protein
MSPTNTQRIKPACARQLFPPEERNKDEDFPYWNRLPTQAKPDLEQHVKWRGRNKSQAPLWAKGEYCAKDVSATATQDDRALMMSTNNYKSFPTNSINKKAAITVLLVLQRDAPTHIQISEFDLEEKSYYYLHVSSDQSIQTTH